MEKVTRFLRNYSTSALFLIVVQPVFYGCTRAVENLDRNRIYFMFYALYAVAFISYVLTFFSGAPPVYTAEHAKIYDFDDTAFQRQTYVFYAAVLFVTAFFLAVTKKQLSFPYLQKFRSNRRLLLETLAAALVLVIALPLFLNYAATITEKRAFYSIVGFLVVFSILIGIQGSVKGLFFLIVLTLLIFFLFFILPLQASFVVADGALWHLDHHWTGVIGHGFMSSVFPPENLKSLPEYGIYLNKLIALGGQLSMFSGFGGTLKFLQVIHLLFAVLVLLILLQRFDYRNPGLVLISFLLVLLILAPTLSALAPILRVPNQSPVRFIFIPIALIFAPFIARPGVLIWWVAAGALSAVAALYNLETGLVCALGLGFSLFIRSMKSGYLVTLLGGILFGTVFLALAFFLLSISGNGNVTVSDLSSLLDLFAAGYGGKTFYWYLPFFVIMAHIFYLFFGWIKNCRQSTALSGPEIQSVALAGMIIAFMPYVTNRFYEQNMWIPVLFYLLLVLPKLASKEFLHKAALLFFIVAVVTPSHLERSTLFVKNLKAIWTMDTAGECLNGLTASSRLCNYVDQQSAELKEMAAKENIVWISGIPLTLSSLSNVPPSLSRADPFAYARTPRHQQELIDEISDIAPDYLMIDRVDILNPTGINPIVADWQKRLVEEAGYDIIRQSDHWIYAVKSD